MWQYLPFTFKTNTPPKHNTDIRYILFRIHVWCFHFSCLSLPITFFFIWKYNPWPIAINSPLNVGSAEGPSFQSVLCWNGGVFFSQPSWVVQSYLNCALWQFLMKFLSKVSLCLFLQFLVALYSLLFSSTIFWIMKLPLLNKDDPGWKLCLICYPAYC